MEKEQEMAELNAMYDHVFDLLEAEKYSEIDNLVQDFAKQQESVLLCVGLLTITHSYNRHLKDVMPLVDRTRLLLERKGASPEQITNTLGDFSVPFTGMALRFKKQ